ncbi:alpha/beta hydrolase [Isoptericola jiangsuensis]|uniref:alpha/beta hydrolase n=1 Tax=Isoptericola jiangsuensis TaxID=548579 RepID=UPI003AAC92C4
MTEDPVAQPFQAELAAVLAAGPLAPTVSAETLDGLRTMMREQADANPVDLTLGGTVRVEALTVPGPDGAPDITLHLFRPATGHGPWPVLYNTHGGGMISGSALGEVALYLPYVAEGLAAVVSVEYRLAPEHPDPAPIEDCYAGLAWTARHAHEYDLDADRLMLIGASAGGGLAAGLGLLARDRGFPSITHQILICPMIDDREVTPSSRMLDGKGVWDRNSNHFGWTSLLGDRRGGPDVSIYAAPARATDLSGLPQTYVDAGGAETFRDEAVDYAQRLAQAGVLVDLHVWGGGFHGFDMLVPQAAISRAAIAVRDEYIRRALAR